MGAWELIAVVWLCAIGGSGTENRAFTSAGEAAGSGWPGIVGLRFVVMDGGPDEKFPSGESSWAIETIESCVSVATKSCTGDTPLSETNVEALEPGIGAARVGGTESADGEKTIDRASLDASGSTVSAKEVGRSDTVSDCGSEIAPGASIAGDVALTGSKGLGDEPFCSEESIFGGCRVAGGETCGKEVGKRSSCGPLLWESVEGLTYGEMA